MTDDKIAEVLLTYEQLLLHALGSGKIAKSRATAEKRRKLRHLLSMVEKMRAMMHQYQGVQAYLEACAGALERPQLGATFDLFEYAKGLAEYGKQREKLMRWLGFMQGTFWSMGIYSIDDMREHNKPSDEPFRERDA